MLSPMLQTWSVSVLFRRFHIEVWYSRLPSWFLPAFPRGGACVTSLHSSTCSIGDNKRVVVLSARLSRCMQKIACLHAGSAARVSLSELKSSADGQYANIHGYHSNCCLCNRSLLTCRLDDTCFCLSVCANGSEGLSRDVVFLPRFSPASVTCCTGVGAAVVSARRRRYSLANLEMDFFSLFSRCCCTKRQTQSKNSSTFAFGAGRRAEGQRVLQTCVVVGGL